MSGSSYIPTLLEALPERERQIARSLADAFGRRNEDLFIVGGTVRDLLLGRSVVDLDFATSAVPEVTKDAGMEAGATAIYAIGEAFGTVGFVFGTDGSDERVVVEITTYRSEVYPSADRRPVVTHGVSLVDDLSRRDFRLNAIALRPGDGMVIDPFGGVQDIANRVIAAVGEPTERFNEDPLRVLRAARFSAQLGFEIDDRTADAMYQIGPELSRISRERIATELNRLLTASDPARGLRTLYVADLIRQTIPEIQEMADDDRDAAGARHKDIWEHTLQVVARSPARLAVRWAALVHDAAKPMTRIVDERGEVHFFGHEVIGAELARRTMRRLRQERALEQRVSLLVLMHLRPAGYDESWTDSAVRRLALEAGDAFDDLLDLAAADVTSARATRQAAAAARVAGLRAHHDRLQAEAELGALQSPLDGEQLMRMFGRPPGIWIKVIKDRLREMVIDGELRPGDIALAQELASGWMAGPDLELANALSMGARARRAADVRAGEGG